MNLDSKQRKKIHLIRHGITEGNQKKLYYGSTNIPLAACGKEELIQLAAAEIYPDCRDAVMFTSGLLRTEQTFSLIYGEREHGTLSAFAEFNFGDFEMKNYEELKLEEAYQEWIADKSGRKETPGGESMEGFALRVSGGIDELLESYKKEAEQRDTILVCHGGVISAIMKHCFPGEKKHMFKWIPDPGHGYSVMLDRGEPADYKAF